MARRVAHRCSAIAPGDIGRGRRRRSASHAADRRLPRPRSRGRRHCYRPFHDALRESLAEEMPVTWPMRPHPSSNEAHRLIGMTLLPRFDAAGGELLAPYARRHLTEHAAAAGQLDAPFLTPTTLPLLDANALSRALRLIEAEPHSRLGLLLGAWRGVRHRWSWERPEANAAALDMAMSAAGDRPAERPKRGALSWTSRWAEWSFGGTVVGAESRGLQAIALGTVAGRACLVTAGYEGGQIWDAATSEPLGPPVAVDPPRRVVIAPTSGGEIVVAAAQSGVQAWDALTGVVRWTAVPADGRPYALAAGVLDGQHLIAVGTSVVQRAS